MNIPENMNTTIKWRGSSYVMDQIENGMVYWTNPVSRHHDKCSVESWKAGIPYEHWS